MVDGIVHFLSANATGLLGQLSGSFDPVWCSGWEEKADEYLPAALGVPAGLPHLNFDAPGPASDPPRHWKLAAIDAFAGPERPLAWVDDAHDDTCHAWANARPGATLLVATQPAVGLTAGHVAKLLEWQRGLGPPRRLAQTRRPLSREHTGATLVLVGGPCGRQMIGTVVVGRLPGHALRGADGVGRLEEAPARHRVRRSDV
jgi:hypothetical protein